MSKIDEYASIMQKYVSKGKEDPKVTRLKKKNEELRKELDYWGRNYNSVLTERNELNAKIAQLRRENRKVEKLKKENKDLEENRDYWYGLYTDMKPQIHELSKANQKLTQNNQSLERTIEILDKDIKGISCGSYTFHSHTYRDLQFKFDAAQRNIGSLNREITKIKQKNEIDTNNLKQKNKASQKTIERLKSKISKLELQHNNSYEKLTKSSEKKISELKKNVSSLKTKNTNKQKEIISLNTEIRDLKYLVASVQQKNDELLENEKLIINKIEFYNNAIKNGTDLSLTLLKNNCDPHALRELEEKIHVLLKERVKYNKHDLLYSAVNDIVDEIDEYNNSCYTDIPKHEFLKIYIERLKSDNKDVQFLQEQNNIATQKLNKLQDLKKKYDDLQNDCHKTHKKLEFLKCEFNIQNHERQKQYKKLYKELTKRNNENKVLKQKITYLFKDFISIKHKLDKTKEETNNKIDSLNARYNCLHKLYESEKNNNATLTKEIKKYTNSNSQLFHINDSLKDEINDLKFDYNQLEQSYTNEKNDNDTLNEKMENLESDKFVLIDDILCLKLKLKKYTDTNKHLITEFDKLEGRYADLVRDNTYLESTNKELLEENNDLNEICVKLEEESMCSSEFNEIITKFNTQINTLQKSNEHLRKESKHFRKELIKRNTVSVKVITNSLNKKEKEINQKLLESYNTLKELHRKMSDENYDGEGIGEEIASLIMTMIKNTLIYFYEYKDMLSEIVYRNEITLRDFISAKNKINDLKMFNDDLLMKCSNYMNKLSELEKVIDNYRKYNKDITREYNKLLDREWKKE